MTLYFIQIVAAHYLPSTSRNWHLPPKMRMPSTGDGRAGALFAGWWGATSEGVTSTFWKNFFLRVPVRFPGSRCKNGVTKNAKQQELCCFFPDRAYIRCQILRGYRHRYPRRSPCHSGTTSDIAYKHDQTNGGKDNTSEDGCTGVPQLGVGTFKSASFVAMYLGTYAKRPSYEARTKNEKIRLEEATRGLMQTRSSHT